ncbi:MAG: RNA polymerase sigma factor [Bacteroidia bacterium]
MNLYEPVHAKLERYVRSILNDRDLVKDIISETVLKAYEHLEDIKKPESFMYYLFRIARNLINNSHRRNKHWGIYDEEQLESIADESADTLAKTELKEFYDALNELTEKQKEAIMMFEVAGFSLEDIHRLQGGSLSGVKSRLGRARSILEHKLEYDKESLSVSFA